MPRAPAKTAPRKPAGRTPPKAVPAAPPPPVAKVAVPEAPAKPPPSEPVWLVRVVLVLFFVGFAAFLAREVYSFVQSLP